MDTKACVHRILQHVSAELRAKWPQLVVLFLQSVTHAISDSAAIIVSGLDVRCVTVQSCVKCPMMGAQAAQALHALGVRPGGLMAAVT